MHGEAPSMEVNKQPGGSDYCGPNHAIGRGYPTITRTISESQCVESKEIFPLKMTFVFFLLC